MVNDFRKKRTATQPLRILGEVIELVEDYKYLGMHIDNKLNWKTNIEAVYKKRMSRLHFLMKLRSFVVCSRMLDIFYQADVASALFYAVVCWGGSSGASNTNRLKKLIRKAGSVIGCELDNMEVGEEDSEQTAFHSG